MKSTADKIEELRSASLVERVELGLKLKADFEIVRRGEVDVDQGYREIVWHVADQRERLRFIQPKIVCSGPWAPKRRRRRRVQKKIDARRGAAKYRDEVRELWEPSPARLPSIRTMRAPLIRVFVPYEDWRNMRDAAIADHDFYRGGAVVWAVDLTRIKQEDRDA